MKTMLSMNTATPTLALTALVLLAASAAAQVQNPVLSGETDDDVFGWSASPAGDVNGDGVADVVVGAPAHDSIAGFAGRAYLFLGPFTANRNGAQANARISATTFGDNLGFSVAGAGDVNADGFDDLLIGARSNDGAGIQAGRVYLFNGPVSGNKNESQANATISGRAFDELGRAVARGGDLDGDGIDDIVVGAPLSSIGAGSAGEAHVFYGPVTGNQSVANADASIVGITFNELLGSALAVGDLDNDGQDDLIVGAPRPPLNGASTGRVYVLFGPVAGVHSAAAADVIVQGETANDEFGTAVSVGDVNGDSIPDLVVGANQFFADKPGRAYVFYGPLGAGLIGAGQADALLLGEQNDDAFGTSVTAAGDLNADGADDVIVGAPSNGAGGVLAGRAYAFFGPVAGTRTAASADRIYTGASLDSLGYSVALAPGLQSNGRDGLLIGSPPHQNSPGAGTVRVEQPADPVVSYCSGDGSGTACPCANSGAAAHGCANSVNGGGALLSWSGNPSIANDTFALHASGMPDGFALFFQGTAQLQGGAGVVLGDGLRCVGGTTVRFGLKPSSFGTAQYPLGGDLSISVRGSNVAGNVRTYQVWYRDSSAFCQPQTFNLTNALEVTWLP